MFDRILSSLRPITTISKEHTSLYEQMRYNKGVLKKPMVQQTLKQNFDNIKTRPHSFRESTVKMDSIYRERGTSTAICTPDNAPHNNQEKK